MSNKRWLLENPVGRGLPCCARLTFGAVLATVPAGSPSGSPGGTVIVQILKIVGEVRHISPSANPLQLLEIRGWLGQINRQSQRTFDLWVVPKIRYSIFGTKWPPLISIYYTLAST